MTRFLFLATLLFVFIIEGTVVQIFSPERWGFDILMIPRFVVVLLIFAALFLGRIQGLFMGLLFGLLYDIIYGNAIGIYGFSMALAGYFSGLTFRIFQQNVFLILLTVAIVLFCHEFLIYGILSLIDYIDIAVSHFLVHRALPTLVLNMIFAVLVSYPVRKLLLTMQEEEN